MAGKALIMWTLLTLYSFCKGQTVLTGPTGKVCPGDPLQYTCERAGVTNSDEPLIIWDFYLNGVRVPSLRINVTVEELNESSSVHHENGRTLMGNFSSPGTVVAVLQVNATSEFNTVACTIVDLSNNITISIRVQCGEQGPPENGMIVAVSGRGEGDNITFQCNSGFTPIGVMSSVCTSNGTWFPDLDTVQCSQVTSTSCPILQTPPNASSNFSSKNSPVGTAVHFQCDPGLFPEGVRTATCLEKGNWDNELSQLMCREMPINCSLPSEPVNGTIMNYPNLTSDEDSEITFQCDPGFMPATVMSATCNNSGLWSTDPALLVCTQVLAGHDVARVVGGVVGGLIVIMLLVLVVTAVVVILLSRRTKEAKSLVTADIEMTDTLQGEYSKLRHDGPKMNGTQKSPPPPVGSEEYDRITHNVHLVPTTCDNITINSKEADDGYSKVNNGQGAQRLPGYAQLNNMAAVEAVVYADLEVVTKKKPSEAPEVDQHTVTYSTLDMAATSRTKGSTMPTPSKGESAEQADKLLNLNQALVQLRSVQSRWKELADALRVPETYIQQIDDMYDKDHVSSMTEIIDCWMRSCGGRPTWRELADALKSIKEDSLAQQLTSIYDTGRLPVELNMNEVPKELYKYDNAPPPPVPARSPTVTDTDSPGLSRTLPPPSKPPRHDGDQLPPSRPPKPSSESRVSCSTPPS